VEANVSGLDIAREGARSRPLSRNPRGKKLKIERKKPRPKRFRGIPPPPTFDIDALPGSVRLNDTEAAAALRRSKACLENWRKDPDHPLKWSRIAGRILYEVSSIRALLKGE
jgi:hypothetical protein